MKKTFSVKLSPKKQAILRSFEKFNYSKERVQSMKKQYLASLAVGLNIQGYDVTSIVRDFRRKSSSYGKDELNKSAYSLLIKSRFKTKGRRFNMAKVVKQIKISKQLNKNGNDIIFNSLTYSDAGQRCLASLKNRVRDSLRLREENQKIKNQSNVPSLIQKLKNQYKANMVKVPRETSKENSDFVGVEIEFISESSESHFKRRAEELKIKNFNIGTDGSIEVDSDENPDDQGHEIRILLENNESYIKTQMKKLCILLSNNDAYVNQSCGLHVHLDVRNKTEKEREEIGNRLKRCLGVLASLVPQSRRDNSYCKLVVGHSDRYSAVNMTAINKYGTIEIRLHSGTVDFLKITNWIKLLNLIKETKNEKTFKSLDEMIEGLRMPDELAFFYYNRYKKFNTDQRNATNEETSLNEASILTIDQITFTENNNQAVTA